MRRETQGGPMGARSADVLAVLREYAGQSLTVAQIAERAERHTSTVTVACVRLAADGLVQRVSGTPPRWTVAP